MNQNRQRMEAALPEASSNLCKFLWNKLAEAGVGVQQQDVVLIGRIVSDYFISTEEGKKTAIKFLKATVRPAPVEHAYYPAGNMRDSGKRLNTTELVEYRGWIYKGKHSAPYTSIDIDNNGGLEACETTGILGPKEYCIKTVKTYTRDGRDLLQNLSNYARLHSEDINIRSEAKFSTCRECKSLGCEYHPVKDSKQLMLTPPIQAVNR